MKSYFQGILNDSGCSHERFNEEPEVIETKLAEFEKEAKENKTKEWGEGSVVGFNPDDGVQTCWTVVREVIEPGSWLHEEYPEEGDANEFGRFRVDHNGKMFLCVTWYLMND